MERIEGLAIKIVHPCEDSYFDAAMGGGGLDMPALISFALRAGKALAVCQTVLLRKGMVAEPFVCQGKIIINLRIVRVGLQRL